jgi:hypothetical protein
MYFFKIIKNVAKADGQKLFIYIFG